MKILLINNDSMVKKLFEAVAKKLGLDLIIQDNLKLPDLEDDFFLFIDEGVSGNYSELLSSPKVLSSVYLHKRTSNPIEGFGFYVKKPFLPTEILDILKRRLADFGITEDTTSNLTKDDLADIPEQSLAIDDFDLDELDELDLKDDDDKKNTEPPKPIPHISDNFDLSDLKEIQNVLDDLEKETKKRDSSEEKLNDKDSEFDFIKVQDDEDKPDARVEQTTEDMQEEPDIEEILKDVRLDIQEQNTQDEKNEKQTDETIQNAMSEFADELDISTIESSLHSPNDDFNLDEDFQGEEQSVISKDDEANDMHFQKDDQIQEDEQNVVNMKKTQDNEVVLPSSGILDKKQIDEVKKILEETQDNQDEDKGNLMAPASKAKQIEEIQEEDIAHVFDDIDNGEDMKEKHTEKNTKEDKEDFDVTFDDAEDFSSQGNGSKKDTITSDSNKQETTEASQANGISNLLNNTSIDGLKSILDGMQLTINISFPDKKK
ncbi:hypothetical protein BKH42_03215 [Helicobacter sp. 13S00482-2]|uniref:hypothetical protein n=1 Tax=Helicobacter sp. 13S00482-2 TaxID=1476200 RepID=UPI000BA70739|nr:hypothetical protein [Helicobacter sp. 13S00482-2]PAF53990.1 hypothetical protein BKH42_03215 [Helicobacter sp. 13S00482-2]